MAPAAEHAEAALHLQDADPAAPTQLWCDPHAIGAPYDRQPLLPVEHVASPLGVQTVCPWLQLSVQVAEQPAVGAIPEQDCGDVHCVVDAT